MPREDQADTRYVSLASAQNNATVSKDQLENMRRGARKMLNSLSNGPSVVNFPEVGPEFRSHPCPVVRGTPTQNVEQAI